MTENLKKIHVDCYRDNCIIASYPFAYTQLPVPFSLPSDHDFICEAKTNLANERLSLPPFSGISFIVRR